MAANYRKILANNVAALMARTPALNSQRKIAKACFAPRRQIGARTIGHLLNTEPDAPQPQLDTIVAVAEAFRVPPWALLSPDFDAESKTVGELPPEFLEFARRLYAQRDIVMDIFTEAVQDADVESHGYSAIKEKSVHDPGSTYERQPKQFKMKLPR